MVTKTDVVREVALCHGVVDSKRLSMVMTQTVTSCQSDYPLHDVLGIIKAKGFVHIPVIDRYPYPCEVVTRGTRCRRSCGKLKVRSCYSGLTLWA